MLALDCDPHTVVALRHGGYEVANTMTLKRARSLLRRRPFSAVVLGNSDAESAPMAVTELRLRTDLPIIVTGTRTDLFHEVRVLDAGADDFVREPLTWKVCSRGCGHGCDAASTPSSRRRS